MNRTLKNERMQRGAAANGYLSFWDLGCNSMYDHGTLLSLALVERHHVNDVR